MCLIALALAPDTDRPLLLASNRDEFLHRPTKALSRWHTDSGELVVAGRDLEAGGTWLGLSARGRVAMLTNVREPGAPAGRRSRGELPLAWLQGPNEASTFFKRLDAEAYSGFNLVVGDLHTGQWHWASNRQAGPDGLTEGWQQQGLAPGLYGLSNAFLDTPWPKTQRLKRVLGEALAHPGDPAELLWPALADATPAAPEALPNTGVSLEAEHRLSSAWVRFPDGRYGTRASTIVEVRRTAQGLVAQVRETSWLADGAQALREERLAWPASTSLG